MKIKAEIREKLINFFSNSISDKGFELVDIQIKPSRQRNILVRFLVDKPGGITVDECTKLNNEIGEIIDKENLIDKGYMLEVASPGLDRPLKTRRDFERAKEQNITIIFQKQADKTEQVTGRLIDIKEDAVSLDVNGNIKTITLDKIRKAKLKIEDLKRD